ncbi:CDP-alcohol phosphatidyltransferase family protein [Jannaschia donghaensis]|uniref:CDP-alcohol phosphatidyltransferase n=1 Tax=Jannaschia donghaensis TaxID=420998 RepID=A0A0M6YLK2_9RHOB|nr:CDP-alcohol phosphatidyltransferase family protein [Jannaschia donghaensis]CTQ51242.1 CDP-alcohol phosphatidyltransferase [Jannaschia donghaensis]
MNWVRYINTRHAGPAAWLAAVAAMLVPGVIGLALAMSAPGAAISLAVFVVGAAIAVAGMAAGYPHVRPGGCNIVTLIRLALTAGLAAALWPPGPVPAQTAWSLLALAALALTLDGVDGWLARRAGLTSAFGARFDMEVDALLAAVLAGILLVQGRAGPEILILGGLRYAFVAATLIWPWLGATLPDSLRRKAVCVVQIGVLTALLAPVVSDGLGRGLALVATLALVWSFAVDVCWLARRR